MGNFFGGQCFGAGFFGLIVTPDQPATGGGGYLKRPSSVRELRRKRRDDERLHEWLATVYAELHQSAALPIVEQAERLVAKYAPPVERAAPVRIDWQAFAASLTRVEKLIELQQAHREEEEMLVALLLEID